MKSANNPFNLHVGDRVTLKGSSKPFYGVTGFTDAGFPVVEANWLVLRGIPARMIESVIRKEKS
mgnify:CR=1 FL=1